MVHGSFEYSEMSINNLTLLRSPKRFTARRHGSPETRVHGRISNKQNECLARSGERLEVGRERGVQE
jgi:hypothetical protein